MFSFSDLSVGIGKGYSYQLTNIATTGLEQLVSYGVYSGYLFTEHVINATEQVDINQIASYGIETPQVVELTERILTQRRYSELIANIVDIPQATGEFLPDYLTVKILAEQSGISRHEVSDVVVALSNLLRASDDYEIEEINLLSMRIKKAGNYWVITEY
ncbi:MAG: hypothetical protein DSY42_09735 [Aquifex sp.]|nr:MAG: hypothetical protein DSY42_09735 [Aquifex sp.]